MRYTVDMKKIIQRVRRKLTGFTLIELLIVLSIVTILSNVVFSTYVDARDTAHDANVKLVLSSLRSSATDDFFSHDPYSFATVCQGTPVDLALVNLGNMVGIQNSDYQCTASTNEWAIVFPLRKAQYWCTDGLGFSNIVTGFLASNLPGQINCQNATYSSPAPEDPPPPPVPIPPPPSPNTAPAITLNGANPFTFWSPSANPFTGNGVGANKYNEPGYTALDAEDGNISPAVFITGPTLLSQSGPNSCKIYTYSIVYGVTDSEGLSAPYKTRTVIHHKCNTSHNNSGYTYGADDNDPSDG